MTQPTQTRHPWRAVYRTVVAAIPGVVTLLYLLPDIAREAGIAQVGWVTAALGVTAAITRVLAMPAVEAWLHRHAPDLAAQPASVPAAVNIDSYVRTGYTPDAAATASFEHRRDDPPTGTPVA
jgi:hypothetical protein